MACEMASSAMPVFSNRFPYPAQARQHAPSAVMTTTITPKPASGARPEWVRFVLPLLAISLLIGVLAGAVQDFIILVASMRRNGRSLPEIAHDELGSVTGTATAVAVLFIVVVALATLLFNYLWKE